MRAVFVLLTICLLISLCTPYVSGPVVQALVSSSSGLALGTAAVSLRRAEGWHTRQVLLPLLAIAVIPLLWMILQCIPVPFGGNPVWQSASTALNDHLSQRITIDPRATLSAAFEYLWFICLVCASTSLSALYVRAERLLNLLMIASLIGLSALVGEKLLLGTPSFSPGDATWPVPLMADIVLLLSVASLHHVWEISRRDAPNSEMRTSLAAAGCVGLLISIPSISAFSSLYQQLAAGCGLVFFLLGTGVRFFRTRPWEGRVAVACIGVVLSFAFVIFAVQAQGTSQREDISSVGESGLYSRLIEDLPLVGVGAGNYHNVAEFYRTANAEGALPSPAIADQWRVGLGTPMFVLNLAMIVAGIIFLFYRSLDRRRGAHYALLGSAVALVTLIHLFLDSGFEATSVATFVGIAIGLAIAQSRSLGRSTGTD